GVPQAKPAGATAAALISSAATSSLESVPAEAARPASASSPGPSPRFRELMASPRRLVDMDLAGQRRLVAWYLWCAVVPALPTLTLAPLVFLPGFVMALVARRHVVRGNPHAAVRALGVARWCFLVEFLAGAVLWILIAGLN